MLSLALPTSPVCSVIALQEHPSLRCYVGSVGSFPSATVHNLRGGRPSFLVRRLLVAMVSSLTPGVATLLVKFFIALIFVSVNAVML